MRFPTFAPRWLAACLAALLLPLTAAAQDTVPDQTPSVIQWRLKNPFRYFKRPEHTLFHIAAWKALKDAGDGPVLALERALAEKTGGRGWGAQMFEHVVDEACWYRPAAAPGTPAARKAAAEACGQYIRPKAHVVVLEAPSLAKPCTWLLDGKAIASKPDCRQPVEASIPYPDGAQVQLQSANAPLATVAIKVEDLLVVGLGDSFGAGDGNPDRPASFRVNRPMSYDDQRAGYPQRYGIESNVRYTDPRFANHGPGWVHRSCHRSLYSHQLRAALQLAIEDPALHRSVTYVGFACTGSTMLTMFAPYNGYEEQIAAQDPPHVRRVAELSQLDILAQVLCTPGTTQLDTATNYNADAALEIGDRVINVRACEPAQRLRTPDLVLLSIGGNDVGFSGLVSNAALRNRYLGYVKLFAEDPRITPDSAKVFMGRIPGRYAAVAKALRAITGLADASRILLTAYPHMHEDANGNPCGSGTDGFDVAVAWSLEAKAVAATQVFMENELTPAMAKASEVAGWTFVAAHRTGEAFRRHGLCAVTAEEAADAALSNTRFPRFKEDGPDSAWQPYKPDEYLPYASRQRWFLTANDAFLAAHYHTRHVPILDGGPEIQLALWSAYSGAFHPTAEGQAAMADAVLAAARKLLGPK